MVVPCIYDEIHDYGTPVEFIEVSIDGKWGLSDRSGKIIVPCLYDDISLENWLGLWSLENDDQLVGYVGSQGYLYFND